MNIAKAIQHIYPHLNPEYDFEVRDEGNGPFIAEWRATEPLPTEQELQSAWNEVMNENPPVSDAELLRQENNLLKAQLEQTNADLAAFMDFVLGGM